MSAAGYGPQKPLKLTLLYNTSENHQKIAIAVASMWKKNLGVDVKLMRNYLFRLKEMQTTSIKKVTQGA
ncbi:hypothetical protein AWZ74_23320 [Shigella sonnei]|nr:hypothetical protein AWZ74_23320 [Shigella sonnei]